MPLACPHCGSATQSLFRALTGPAQYIRCGVCGGLGYLNPEVRRATVGLVLFLAALLLSLFVGGTEIYNRETASRFPWLFWPLVLAAAATVAYLVIALRQPLRKSEAKHAP